MMLQLLIPLLFALSHAYEFQSPTQIINGPKADRMQAQKHYLFMSRDSGRDQFKVITGPAEELGASLASGEFSTSHVVSQFAQLRIKTHNNMEGDAEMMRAAGYLEGYLTAQLISDYLVNLRLYILDSGYNDTDIDLVYSWLLWQEAWVRKEVGKNNSPLWSSLELVMSQINGMLQGYNAKRKEDSSLPPLELKHLLLLNAAGDTLDLLPMLTNKTSPDLSSLPEQHAAWTALSTSGHCTALIKVTGDLSDILFGHVTWFTYRAMIRIYKHYDFSSLSSTQTMINTVFSFSSYPGALTSIDDFMLVKKKDSSASRPLVIMETTNTIFDTTLYQKVNHRSLLSYQRVSAANYLAASGKEWVKLVVEHSSGTYANQYMALDLSLFQPGKPLQQDLLWIVELIPGYSESKDVTEILERGYWPSYNVPVFAEIYKRSGYASQAEKLTARWGEDSVALGLDYQLAPRAKIFRRDQGGVSDLESFSGLMRSSRWTNDSYSGGAGVWGAICPRGDLDSQHPVLSGGTDAKISSTSLLSQVPMGALVIAGPSRELAGTFSFSGFKGEGDKSHKGMPDAWITQFELQSP